LGVSSVPNFRRNDSNDSNDGVTASAATDVSSASRLKVRSYDQFYESASGVEG
jgi:hypothetical protein